MFHDSPNIDCVVCCVLVCVEVDRRVQNGAEQVVGAVVGEGKPGLQQRAHNPFINAHAEHPASAAATASCQL